MALSTSEVQRIAERLIEDEALRDGLDDDTWQVVQDWLLRKLEEAGRLPDVAAEPLERVVRRTGQALVGAIRAAEVGGDASGELQELGRQLEPPLFDRSNVLHAQAALAHLADDLPPPPLPAPEMARRLVDALDGRRQDRPPRPAASSPARRRSVLPGLALLVGLLLLGALVSRFVAPRPAPAPAADGAVGWEVAFTAPLIPDNDPSRHQGSLDARLVALMDGATQTLDVADYDFDLAVVADAMARAAGRGVRVRMVTDSDTLANSRDRNVQAAFGTLSRAGIRVVADERQPIMHHKFTVADGEWVETGSWNYTDGDTYRLNNNMAVFHSRELAQNFSTEFEKMFGQHRFGPSKPGGVPFPAVQVGSLRIQTFFSPQDDAARRVIDAIRGAQRKIRFLAFSFTHDGIGEAMMGRARGGVEVQGVFESTGSNTSFSEFGAMKRAGLDVYQDGSPYAMHHKVIVLDDRVTIFGSFNFSDSADRDNDENLLIVEDPQFASQFDAEFQRVLARAKR